MVHNFFTYRSPSLKQFVVGIENKATINGRNVCTNIATSASVRSLPEPPSQRVLADNNKALS